MLAVAVAVVATALVALAVIGSVARPAKPRRARRSIVGNDLQDPASNFPQDDSREDMQRYRSR